MLNENPALFKKALKSETNIYDFILESATQNENPTSVDGKKHILSRTLSFIGDIENEIVKEHYLKKLATLLDTSYESVVKEAERAKQPQAVQKPTLVPTQKKPRQELLEDHLLTLIVQSPKPKEAVAIVTNIMNNVDFTTQKAHKIFTILRQYFVTSEELSVAEINKLLPEDLMSAFDLLFLIPLPIFQTDDAFSLEIEKIAKSVRQQAVKSQLQTLSEKMKIEEKNGNEEELQKLREAFSLLATNFK